jgi:hypothetical protein
MKKLILFLTIIFVTITIEAQQFRGMILPVSEHPYFSTETTADRNLNGIILPRFNLGVTGKELCWNKAIKKFDEKTLIKAGGGVSFDHNKLLKDGTIYNDWSVNVLVLMSIYDDEPLIEDPELNIKTPEPTSIAVTVSVHEVINAGLNVVPKYFQKGSDYFPVSLIWGLSYTF